MAEYSKMAKGHFTSTGAAQYINLPFQPSRVEMLNYTKANAGAAASVILSAKWDASMGQGFAVVEAYTGASALVYDTVTTNGISSFSAGLSLQYGSSIPLGGSGGIAKTSATVLTVTTTNAHGLAPGDWVVGQNLYQTSTTGMQQIAGIPFEVLTAPTTTTFTIGWVGNSSNLTAITSGGSSTASFKKILYPALYVPGCAVPWAISQSSGVVTVKTTAPHNYQVGQQIAFRIPSAWGANELNESTNSTTPGNPQTFYVASVTRDAFTFNYSGSLTTFTVNQTFASFPGLKFPEVVAVGDVNSGGTAYSGSQLYPSPQVYNGYSNTSLTNSINGPAILGAYINNTSQGFLIGAGAGTTVTSGVLVGAASDVIYWTAYYDDLIVN